VPVLSETSMKTGLFSRTRTKPRIYRFRILSSAFVRSRPFSRLASAMTLEMTLAVNVEQLKRVRIHSKGSSLGSRLRTTAPLSNPFSDAPREGLQKHDDGMLLLC